MSSVYVYDMRIRVEVTQAEPHQQSESMDHVVDAVQSLLEDNAREWLLEAIGHPCADGFSIKVQPLNKWETSHG